MIKRYFAARVRQLLFKGPNSKYFRLVGHKPLLQLLNLSAGV